MRKYSLFTIVFIFFTLFFSFHQANTSDAFDGTATEGEACFPTLPGSSLVNPLNKICKPSLTCVGAGPIHPGTCQTVQTQNVKCICRNPGNASDKQNAIDCPGMPSIFCGKNAACSSSQSTVDNSNLNFNGNDSAYNTKTLTGFMCSSKKSGNATCSCTGNGTDGQNGFKCTLDSDPTQTATGTCGSSSDQCQAAAGQSVDTSTVKNYTGFLANSGVTNDGYTITGVACRRPEAKCTCTNPGQTGTGQNGFTCTQFNQTQTDYCNPETSVCNNAPDGTIDGGTGTKSKIFSGAPLHGISCTDGSVTLPPPPSPPCKTWSNGQCTMFSSAVGDLATDPGGFVKTIFSILLSFSGGIALLLIIRAGYQLLTSQGKPEQVNQARDQLVAAIVGLVFLIFSFVVLETIGVDILHICGFKGTDQSGTTQTSPCNK
ncbi:MAG: pilin [Candidatus Levyibacteriota bacterium]